MNKVRRKKIATAYDLLLEALTEEQEAFDNLPESLQDAEKGQAMQEGVDKLEEITGELENFFQE